VAALSTAHQAHSIASDILCRSHPLALATRQVQDTPPGFILAAASSRAAVSPKPGCLPSTSVASSASAYAGPTRQTGLTSFPTWGTDSSATRHRDPGVSTVEPAFSIPSPPSSKLRSQTQTSIYSKLATRFEGLLGPDAARRLLQPRQLTSTTTNRSIPCRTLDATRPACAGLRENLSRG